MVNCESPMDVRMQRAMDMFLNRNPGVEFEFLEMNDEQLMANLGEADVLRVDTQSAPGYIQAGVRVDLNDADILSALESWCDIRNIASHGDTFYGVPEYVIVDLVRVNSEFANYLSFDLPLQTFNWSQLFEIGLANQAEIIGRGAKHRPRLRLPN